MTSNAFWAYNTHMLNTLEQQMSKVEIVEVDVGTEWGMTKATLKRGNDYATLDGMLYFEEEDADDDLFDEWVDAAMDGVKGYTAMIVEGNTTVLYGA